MTAAEMAQVMIAFDNGDKVQVKYGDAYPWQNIHSPEWDWIHNDYRIAPKPSHEKYRPFTAEEFKPHRDRWVRSSLGKSSDKAVNRILAVLTDGLSTKAGNFTFEDAVEYLVFDDTGEPCGVEEA